MRDTKIEIAVPYAAEVREAPTIFVKGRIANVRPAKDGGTGQGGILEVREE